jgi:hypothetical protein
MASRLVRDPGIIGPATSRAVLFAAKPRRSLVPTRAGEFRSNALMDPRGSGSRAGRLVVRRFASAAEADRHDLEYWLSFPPHERLLQVWRLSEDLWRWRGEFRDEPGLSRSVASVRRP